MCTDLIDDDDARQSASPVTRGRETRGGGASACVFYLINLTFGSRGTNRPSVRGGGKRKFVGAGDDGTRLSERAFFFCVF